MASITLSSPSLSRKPPSGSAKKQRQDSALATGAHWSAHLVSFMAFAIGTATKKCLSLSPRQPGARILAEVRQELPLFAKSGKKIPKAFLMLAVKQGEAN